MAPGKSRTTLFSPLGGASASPKVVGQPVALQEVNQCTRGKKKMEDTELDPDKQARRLRFFLK